MDNDIKMEVLDIRLVLPGNQPLVMLVNEERNRMIQLWVGTSEAMAITIGQHRVETPRPMTHQLLVNALALVGDELQAVRINNVDDEIYFAELVLASGKRIDSRASDAIAVSLLAEVPIFCARHVLDDAGTEILDEDIDDSEPFPMSQNFAEPSEADMNESLRAGSRAPGPSTGDPFDDYISAQNEESVDKFREFLDTVSPDDFRSDDDPPEAGDGEWK